MEILSGCQGEALRLAYSDVEDEDLLVPGLVEPPVDIERAAVDVSKQCVDVADDELSQREAHGGASGAAPARRHEHHGLPVSGAVATDRLARRRGGRDA